MPPANLYGVVGAAAGKGSSGKVDRKMQGRLQSGGAVLWFLRKHAPMPTPFSTLGMNETEATSPNLSVTEVPQRPATSLGVALDRPQQRFLHRTVRAIGTELEEMHPASEELVRVRGGHTNAFLHRENLRGAFAAHSEAECERLRNDVAAREAEVRDLQLKCQQMERWVQATKIATQNRTARKNNKAGGNTQRKLSTSGSKIRRVSAPQTPVVEPPKASPSVSDVGDGEEVKAVENALQRRTEDYQALIARQSDQIRALRTKIDEQNLVVQQNIVQKKSTETSLFVSNTEVLKLRASARKAEERAVQLANELKKVYQDLPAVMNKRLEDAEATTCVDVKNRRLKALLAQNREEHFKFLGSDELIVHSNEFDNRIKEVSEFVNKGLELLQANRELANVLQKRTMEMRDSMAFLQTIWTKLVKRALEVSIPSGTPTPAVATEQDEGPELLLFRAGSVVDTVQENLAYVGSTKGLDLNGLEVGSPRSNSSPSPRSLQRMASTSPTPSSPRREASSSPTPRKEAPAASSSRPKVPADTGKTADAGVPASARAPSQPRSAGTDTRKPAGTGAPASTSAPSQPRAAGRGFVRGVV